MRPAPWALVLIGCFAPAFGQGACACSSAEPGAGPAWKVHGRLSAWNGTPTFRIWVIGTTRILGVHASESKHALPENLRTFVDDFFATSVVGDFVVCPLTRPRPGVMQMVCIQSATHLVRKPRR